MTNAPPQAIASGLLLAVCDALPRNRTAAAPRRRRRRDADKWRGWILAVHGHGPEWARVFNVGPLDSEQIWLAIAAAVLDAPVSTIRNRAPYGVVCGVEVELTINDRRH